MLVAGSRIVIGVTLALSVGAGAAAVPTPTPVIKSLLLTVATAVLVELQIIDLLYALTGNTVAVSVSLLPTVIAVLVLLTSGL